MQQSSADALHYEACLSRVLRELRSQRGYQQREMAGLLGVSPADYWQIEQEKKSISVGVLYDFAKIMHVAVPSLLTQAALLFYAES
jgi:transcriptional regulator with XRE-family HTH domain